MGQLDRDQPDNGRHADERVAEQVFPVGFQSGGLHPPPQAEQADADRTVDEQAPAASNAKPMFKCWLCRSGL